MSREGAVRVAERLREAGHEAWLAGGCVRDLLLGKTPKDWDIATDARPERVQALFRRTVAVGAAFGVVQVLEREGAYEVATFRTDGDYVDGRRPSEVVYSESREEDVRRRDFTINALLMDPKTEEILDYVGGRADLAAGVIRAVGVPRDRFGEDRLRMLRAVRFAARLDFEIEPETWAALVEQSHRLKVVSPERITAELEGIFLSPRPGLGARLLEASSLSQVCLPSPRPADLAAQLDRLPSAAAGLDKEATTAVAWALVHREVERDRLEGALRERKLSRSTLRAVQDLFESERVVAAAEDPPSSSDGPGRPRASLLRLARGAGARSRRAYLEAAHGSGSALLRRFEAAEGALAARPPAEDAFLTGEDLKALGLKPGPRFKHILTEVEGAILEGEVTSKAEALERARDLAVETP